MNNKPQDHARLADEQYLENVKGAGNPGPRAPGNPQPEQGDGDPGPHFTDEVAPLFPAFVTENLRYALPRLGQRLRGFDHPDALLTGPETRSSSPVRILRNPRRESPIAGLYPIGEGAGYAGGIISAAVDGLLAGLEDGKEKP